MSEAFFNVGDVITVRSDLDMYKRYGSDGDTERTCSVVHDMLRYAGKQFKIEYVYKNGRGSWRYHIAGQTYVWTDEMFEEYINRNVDVGEFEPATGAEFLSLLYGGRK